jgi:NADH pyrophosphatase NudC (nudix superfamily)
LPLFADAFYRIYDIEIIPQGNDIVDAKSIAEKIDVQINVYSCDRKILYTTSAATAAASTTADTELITVHLLLDNNHFDPIVKISAFAVKEEITRCSFCNANGECIKNADKIICSTCNKSYFNRTVTLIMLPITGSALALALLYEP